MLSTICIKASLHVPAHCDTGLKRNHHFRDKHGPPKQVRRQYRRVTNVGAKVAAKIW